MRLLSYGDFGRERAGFLDGDRVFDLEAAMARIGCMSRSVTRGYSWNSRNGVQLSNAPGTHAPRYRRSQSTTSGSERLCPCRASS